VAGIAVAALLFPVVGGLGLLSNQISASVNRIGNRMSKEPLPLVSTVTDATGAPIATLYDQYRLPASSQQISNTMKVAIVSIEDREFYSESALNPRSVVRAALHDTGGGSTQGASTISQQYVKNYLINVVDRHNQLAQNEDRAGTLARKVREARLAVTVAQQETKEQILTGYLNVVAFGARIYGINAAARHYFGIAPDNLDIEQAALLAGMVNNPSRFDPYQLPARALARRNTVIDAMTSTGAITPGQAAAAQAQPLGVRPQQPVPSGNCYGAAPDAGFFCAYVMSYLEQVGFTQDQILSGGYLIRTTMDPNISRIAKQAADDRVPTDEPGVANPFVIVKPGLYSHDVLAMVSNRDYGTDVAAGQTSTDEPADVSVPFGAGSIFKIFTTAAALEEGKVGLHTELPDPYAQCFFPPDRNQYTRCATIHNDTTHYPNPITLQQGLASSPNVAFTDLELRTGMSNVLTMASRLGLRQTMRDNMYGRPPSAAPPGTSDPGTYTEPQSRFNLDNVAFTLGFSPFSPLELSNVGATLLDHGRWCPPNPIRSVTDRYGRPVPVAQLPCQQVIAPGVADALTAGLGNDIKPGGTSAAAAFAAGWRRPTAAKTGTTQNNESDPFLGMVDGYAATSVVYADGSPPGTVCNTDPPTIGSGCAGGFGGTVAAPTFFAAFDQILTGRPDQPLPIPDPSYMGAQDHGPIVPYVVGQQTGQADRTLAADGYPSRAQSVPSSAPANIVVGQTPQGNVTTGQQVTLFVSTGSPTPAT
jgi:membrane peptidoglycan carboxypeptidase